MAQQENYVKSTLENGLRVITSPMPASRSVTIMLMAGVGSRYEDRRINGISHFMEHMFFKGAEKYGDAMAVSSAIDGVGGSFNAFTSEEKVAYFVKLSSSKKKIAYDVLSDMLLKSKFDSEEIDRERGVIIEEIRMYNDDPMSRVQQNFKSHFYGDQPLGWDIAGPEQVILDVSRDDFINFKDKHYTAGNCALVAAGGLTHEENLELAREFFTFENRGEVTVPVAFESMNGGRTELENRDIEQAHFVLGFPIPGEMDPIQPVLKLFTNILGGTMSSRLFYQVRERRGLAYYIRASRHSYSDAGSLKISAGINLEKLGEALDCVMDELANVAKEGVTAEELERGRENIKGRLDLSLEDSMSLANLYAAYETVYGVIKTPDDLVSEIDSVTLEQVNEAARLYLDPENVKLSILGPYDDQALYDKSLDRLANG
jgi:predicted Zn-dependent peptidase